MLEVEIDVFSGMPNPTFELSDGEEQELTERITAEPEQVAAVADSLESFGLGYRGLILRQVKTDAGAWSKAMASPEFPIPGRVEGAPGARSNEFRLGVDRARSQSAADWLLALSERKGLAISDEVREVVRQGVQLLPAAEGAEERPPEGDFDVEDGDEPGQAPRGATWWACNSAYYSANASYFNTPDAVGRNNCYCFAANHLANSRYALPGRRGGRPATSMSCGACIDGLRADGWIDSCQVSTLTIAMVIWPGNDYHFYRVVTAGPDWWWGHKPGGTPARYTDNSNRAIKQPLSPINCNRGPYTHFCGYFYQNNATAFVA